MIIAVIVDTVVERFCTISLFGNGSEYSAHAIFLSMGSG
jgi:hypothetical protein